MKELEKFDQMITALMQAYWSLVTQRCLSVAEVETATATPAEEKFYQLHLDFKDQIESSEL